MSITYMATDGDDVTMICPIKTVAGPGRCSGRRRGRQTPSDRLLSFKKAPNFESPADADMDNMYMVTVVATDAKKLTAMRDVVITVTNADEAGTITLSSVQPKVGRPFTASLTDPDGETTNTEA